MHLRLLRELTAYGMIHRGNLLLNANGFQVTPAVACNCNQEARAAARGTRNGFAEVNCSAMRMIWPT
jgi:hypothetical protein